MGKGSNVISPVYIPKSFDFDSSEGGTSSQVRIGKDFINFAKSRRLLQEAQDNMVSRPESNESLPFISRNIRKIKTSGQDRYTVSYSTRNPKFTVDQGQPNSTIY